MFSKLFRKKEVSKGGSQILRYKHAAKNQEFTGLSSEEMEEVEKHVEKYVGKIKLVYHEIVSESLHLDLLFIPPTDKVPFNTLVTMGASEFKMKVPDALKNFSYAEFVMFLPPDWPMDKESLQDEKNYWPVRLLKTVARTPKLFDTWFYAGHTIPNQNPPERFDKSTDLKGSIITFPYAIKDTAFFQQKTENKNITYWCIAPIYESEWQYKLDHGSDKFEELAEQKGIQFFIVDPQRETVA